MAIELKGVTKRYGTTTALDNVSVKFGGGIVYGLLGANGAGKTTMMNIITNRIWADEGEITIDGESAPGNDRALGKVYMMAEANLFPDSMKVDGALKLTKSYYPTFDMDYAMSVAEKFALPTKKKVKALSTGYASIFRLTLALSVNCPYVIFDEPVLGLDAQHRDLFYRLLMEKCAEGEQTVILSTHLIQEAAKLIGHAVIIKNGRILRDADADELSGAAYQVSGPAAAVDNYLRGRHVLSVNSLGGLKTACVEGAPDGAPEGLEISGMDLQDYFIGLMNEQEGVK
ncbi:MAG TPA: ABC transporter ATP-binding protein [Candidatus Scatomorpha gallistercoris]|nr:ABC transporter ATP-binding protein [Candidatus Scatomorpha gallistercoris]